MIMKTKLCSCLIVVILSLQILSGCNQQRLSPEQLSYREQEIRKLLRVATFYLREQDLNRAESVYSLALELDPQDPRAIDGLGSVAAAKKNYNQAIWYFKKALVYAPQYDRPYEHLAFIAEQEGQFEIAKKMYGQALALNPLNFRARTNLGILNSSRQQLEQALTTFEDNAEPSYQKNKIERQLYRTE